MKKKEHRRSDNNNTVCQTEPDKYCPGYLDKRIDDGVYLNGGYKYNDRFDTPDDEFYYIGSSPGVIFGEFISNKGTYINYRAAHCRDDYGDSTKWKECLIYGISKGYYHFRFSKMEVPASVYTYIIDNFYEVESRPVRFDMDYSEELIDCAIAEHAINTRFKVKMIGALYSIDIRNAFDEYEWLKMDEMCSAEDLWFLHFARYVLDMNYKKIKDAIHYLYGRCVNIFDHKRMKKFSEKILKMYEKNKDNPEIRARFTDDFYNVAKELGIQIER